MDARPRTVVLELDGRPTALVLVPHTVRSDRFQLLIQESAGSFRPIVAPPARTFRGEVHRAGAGGGRIVASRIGGGLTGIVAFDDGSERSLVVSWPSPPDAPADGLAIDVTASLPDDDEPGSNEPEDDAAPDPGPDAAPPPSSAPAAPRVIEVGVDVDHELFVANGSSVAQTLADVEAVMNGVSAAFEAAASVRIEVTTVVIRTTDPDPYTFTSSGGLLSQFRGEWNTQLASVHRDLALLLTGRDLDNADFGAAYFSVMCSATLGYSLSQQTYPSLQKRVAAAAHHLARNLGAAYCDGANDCAIMCSTLNGCNGMSAFGSGAQSKIQSSAANAICASDDAPAGILPFSDAFAGPAIDATLWTYVDGAALSSSPSNLPSAPYALRLSADGSGTYADHEVRSQRLDLSANESATLRLKTLPSGVESGESFVVEYTTGSVTWNELLRVTSNGSTPSTFTSHELVLPAAALAEGFRLRLRAEVNATNDVWYVDDVVLLEIDLAPPVLGAIQSSPDPLPLGQAVAVSVTATDAKSGVDSVVLTVKDGAPVFTQAPMTAIGGGTYRATLAGELPWGEKTYGLLVDAVDAQGNVAQTTASLLVRDLPAFSSPLASPPLPLDDEPIQLSVLVTDSSAIASVTADVSLNGGAATTLPLAFDAGDGRYELNLPAIGSAGTLSVDLDAVDVHGNASNPFSFSVDVYPSVGVPPVIKTPAITPNPLESGQPLSVVVKVTDPDSPVATVTARVLQSASEIATTSLTSGANGNWSGTFASTAGLIEGPYGVELTATDIQDNVAVKSFVADAFEAPVVAGATVTPGALDATEAFTVSAQVTHASGIQWAKASVALNGGTVETVFLAPAGGDTFSASFEPTVFGGSLHVEVWARSVTGHTSTPVEVDVAVAVAPLELDDIEPASGSVGGSTSITLRGAGMKNDVDAGSVHVRFGGIDATAVTIVDDATITALTPAHPEGIVSVQLSMTKNGTPFSRSLASAFEYGIPPTVASIHPEGGSAHAETTVLVTGTGLLGTGDPADLVVLCGDRVAETVQLIDDQRMLVTVPGGATPGSVDSIVVTHPFGTSTLPQAFLNSGVALRTEGSVDLGAFGRPTAAVRVDDLNDDGEPDLAVGVGGAGVVVIRDGAGFGAIDAHAGPGGSSAGFGAALLFAVDLDADGAAELLVGEPGADPPSLANAGAVHAVSPVTGAVVWTRNGAVAGGAIGTSLALLGDLNGDGVPDVAAGAPGASTGSVLVLDGQSGSILQTLSGAANGDDFGDRIDAFVAPGGDAFLAVSAPDALTGKGRAELYRIARTTLDVTLVAGVDGDQAGAPLGPNGTRMSVVAIGEDRLGAGWPGSDEAGSNFGLTRIVAAGQAETKTFGTLSGDSFGAAMASLPDLDGDGVREALVGAPGVDAPLVSNVGAVKVLSGATGSILGEVLGDGASRRVGGWVATGDVDVGGLFELRVGSPTANRLFVSQVHPATFTRPAASGDQLSGQLKSRLDRDGLRFEMVTDEALVISVTAVKKEPFPLVVTVHDADGELLLSSDPGSPAFDAALVTVKGKKRTLTFTAGGLMTIHVLVGRAGAPAVQKYKLAAKRKTPASIALDQAVPYGVGALLDVFLEAPVGAKLAGSVSVPKGNHVQVIALPTPDGGDLVIEQPLGFKSSKKADKVTLVSSKLVLDHAGTYIVRVEPQADETGTLKLALEVLLPSGKKKHTDDD